MNNKHSHQCGEYATATYRSETVESDMRCGFVLPGTCEWSVWSTAIWSVPVYKIAIRDGRESVWKTECCGYQSLVWPFLAGVYYKRPLISGHQRYYIFRSMNKHFLLNATSLWLILEHGTFNLCIGMEKSRVLCREDVAGFKIRFAGKCCYLHCEAMSTWLTEANFLLADSCLVFCNIRLVLWAVEHEQLIAQKTLPSILRHYMAI